MRRPRLITFEVEVHGEIDVEGRADLQFASWWMPPLLMDTDVQIIWISIFRPCCDDVIAWALEQFFGPCNNGNEAVEEMPRSVKI